jgi:hypothetical protein
MLAIADQFITLVLLLSDATTPAAADLAKFRLFIDGNWAAQHVQTINLVLQLRGIDQKDFMERFRVARAVLVEFPAQQRHSPRKPKPGTPSGGEEEKGKKDEGALQGNGKGPFPLPERV